MLAIDWKTKIFYPGLGADCIQYSNQFFINFHGVTDAEKQLFNSVWPYDFSTNQRFNLPVLEISTYDQDASGKPLGSHMWNTIILGDNAYTWNDLCNIEPQDNMMNVQPGQEYFGWVNTKLNIRGQPMRLGNLKVIMEDYCGYQITNYAPSLYPYESPIVKFVHERIK